MSNLYILQDDGLRKLNGDLTVNSFIPITNCRYATIDPTNIYVYANNILKKIDLETFSITLSHSAPEVGNFNSPEIPMASDTDSLYISARENSGDYTIRKIDKETLAQTASSSLGSLSPTYGITAKDGICYAAKRIYSVSSLTSDTAQIIKVDFNSSETTNISLPFFGADPILSQDGTQDENSQTIHCAHDLEIPLFIFSNKLYIGYYSTKSYTRVNANTTFGRVEDLNTYLLPINTDSDTAVSEILMPANFNQSFNYNWSGLDPDTWTHTGIMNMGPAIGNAAILYLTAFGDNVSSGNNPTHTQHLYLGKYNNGSLSSITLSANSGVKILSIGVDSEAGMLYVGTDGENDDYSDDEANNLIKISLADFSVVSYHKISSTASGSYSENSTKNAILSILSDSTVDVSTSDSIKLDAGGISIIKSDVELEDLSGNSTDFLPDEQVQLTTLTGDAKVFKNYSREKSKYLDIQIHIG